MDNRALLQAVGAGDRNAFTELYRCNRRTMLAYAASIMAGDGSAAEDAVDEAFADVWQKAARAQAVGNVGGWLRRIVRNKAIDMLRKDSRTVGQSEEMIALVEDQAPNPEHMAMLGDERRWLREALQVLNADQREVVVLCYFEGMSIEQIARETQSPANTVKTRLYYARRKLFEHIESDRTDTAFAHLGETTAHSSLVV